MSEPSSEKTWSGRLRGNVLGYWIFHQLLRIVGRDAAGILLMFVTLYYWLGVRASRLASRTFLQRFHKQHPTSSLTVYAHLLSFGDVLLDRACMFSGAGGTFTFTYEGEDHIRTALAQGRGVILVSAHVGNWEVAGSLLRERISHHFSVAMVRAEANRLSAYLKKKQDAGLSVIGLDDEDGSLQMLAALRRGDIVAMHGDRFLPGARTRRVPFLGASAAFPEGPFHIAAIAGCPIITCFAIRTGKRRYAFSAFPPQVLDAAPAQREQAVGEAVQLYASRVEAMVKRHPLQWFNFYDFWA